MNAILDPSSINTSFSKKLPGMQLAIDSTSLGLFKTCPFKYQLEIVEGWQARQESQHLTFGILLHQAREGYEHSKAKGRNHEECLDDALNYLLRATWNQELGRPSWISTDPYKNRLTLIQTAVWYLDDKARDDPLETVLLENGKPAVELSFRFPSGVQTRQHAEDIVLCGHLDRIARLNDLYYIPDIKTSKNDVTKPSFANGFSPDNQFSLYSIAGKVAFGFEVEGLMVDGVQVGVGFARFQRSLVPRTPAVLEEWLRDFAYYVEQMELCATRQWWPKNDKSCSMYGGCQFRETCSRSPASRQKWLEVEFRKRVWDPLIARGE